MRIQIPKSRSIPGHDHFSVIAPLAEKLADQIVNGQVNVTQQTMQGLR